MDDATLQLGQAGSMHVAVPAQLANNSLSLGDLHTLSCVRTLGNDFQSSLQMPEGLSLDLKVLDPMGPVPCNTREFIVCYPNQL